MTWLAFRTARIIEAVQKNTRGQIIDWADEIEKGIIAAIEEERCAIAFRLGEMTGESRSSTEREVYRKVMQMIYNRERCNKSATENNNT